MERFVIIDSGLSSEESPNYDEMYGEKWGKMAAKNGIGMFLSDYEQL